MNLETARVVIDDDTLTDDQLSVLLQKAMKEALTHYFWKLDDIPSEEEENAFYDKWEFQIYDVAKAMNSDTARDGLISHTELGITRQWGESGRTTINKALSAIPCKAYVI